MSKAVLFDMDGLLVDTETLGINVVEKIMGNFGIILKEFEKRKFIGITDEKFYKNLLMIYDINLSLEEVLHLHFKLYEIEINENLIAFPGAIELVKKLKKTGYTLAIVSGSTRKQILMILESLGISDKFSVIISCSDVKKGKPYPDGYLLAVKKLKVQKNNSIILEDSENGIISGKAANICTIGVKNKGMQDITNADFIVRSLEKLVDLKLINNLMHFPTCPSS